MSRITLISILAALLLVGCNTSKVVTPPAEEMAKVEIRTLDTLVVSADPIGEVVEEDYELPIYHASSPRNNDILHSKIEVSFDWEGEQVTGRTTLTVKPYFYPVETLVLDAKKFEFKNIHFAKSNQSLKYQYDDQQITIDLGRSFTKDETYTIVIDYIATPKADGGSAVITSDKGLYFINPKGEDPDKPQQIWTQGETESNSRWFPTIDKPNERMTTELFITVQDRFKTLSNGLLVGSTKKDGKRTDHWKMDKGIAPYLVMLAVGDYAVVKDKWRNIDLGYWVEPEYEADAKAIFANTPEMLEFFSTRLNTPYPWSKFDQIIVRDYVSGAMENATAVIFGEFIQRHSRELIDNNNDQIIAHEMFHHWFGDFVTCENWGNLTLNEGFANYAEYLWQEYKYGHDAADEHLFTERMGYFNSAAFQGMHPLIDFSYQSREDMFDAHSYNKGGAVLHMLRKEIGDDAFWAGLNLYLKNNAYQSVEVHDLRLAFEEVTGQDLNWFFNQWYLDEGHPVLDIKYDFDKTNMLAQVTVTQQQDGDSRKIFILPTTVNIYLGPDQVLTKEIKITERIQSFQFEVPAKPNLITLDPNHLLLTEYEDNKTTEDYIFQCNYATSFEDRYKAIDELAGEVEHNKEAKLAIEAKLNDAFWGIRELALNSLSADFFFNPKLMEKIRDLALNDPHSSIRSTALNKLADVATEKDVEIARKLIEKEQSYLVLGAALSLITQVNEQEGILNAKKLEDEENDEIRTTISQIYLNAKDPQHLPFFRKWLRKVDGYSALSFYSSYGQLASYGSDEEWNTTVSDFKTIAIDPNESLWRKLSAAKTIFEAKEAFRKDASTLMLAKVEALEAALKEIKEKETNRDLRALYEEQF